MEKQFIAVFWSWGGVAERCSANPLIRRFHPKTNCDCLEAWHAAFDYIVTCPFAGKLQSVVVCCWKNNSVKRTSLRLIDKTANSVLHLMTNTLPGLTKYEIREEKILIGKVYYYAEVIVPWCRGFFFINRLQKFVPWLSRTDNLWEIAWTREKSSAFDFLTDSKLLFILASVFLLARSVDTTTSLWSPEIITLPSEAVVLTWADQAIWGTATKHR